jgi:hypothetical protein
MTRRMSCSMTVDAVRDRTKTVTRRHVDTWKNLKAGDRLTLIEKGMGLAKGEKQVVLADVKILSVWLEPLVCGLSERTPGGVTIDRAEVRAEGFDPDEWEPAKWAEWWAANHGYKQTRWERYADGAEILVTPTKEAIYCRRIDAMTRQEVLAS